MSTSNMRAMKQKISLLALLVCSLWGYGQIGTNDYPLTMADSVLADSLSDTLVPVVVLPPVDTSGLGGEEDTVGTMELRFAVVVETDIDFMTLSVVHTLENGDVIRRLKIRSPGAHALSLIIDDYWLPSGCKLHVYSEDERYLAGGFTSFNNRSDGLVPIQFIPGETIVMEYFEPAGTMETADLFVDKVLHDYVGVFGDLDGAGESLDCIPNVTCAQGNEWRDEIRSVVRLAIGRTLCSGVLLNNTSQDNTAFVLTGLHCFDQGSVKDGILSPQELQNARSVVAYFNYQCFDCAGGDDTFDGKLQNKSLGGGEVVAFNKNTDFALVKFENPPPPEFAPYYAGWNATGAPTVPVLAGISHPRGDRKKIALDNDPAGTAFGVTFPQLLNPITESWTTLYNVGHVQGGSSGSPLFEQDGYVLGQLVGSVTGVSCTSGPVRNWYGKISASWNGPNAASRLRDWLDPMNTGALKLEGMDPMCSAGLIVSNKTYGSGVADSERGFTTISAGPAVIIGSGSTVHYIARENVVLNPGFKAESGSNFLARVNAQEDCPSHPIAAIFGPDQACRTTTSTYTAKVMFGKQPYDPFQWSNDRNNKGQSGPASFYGHRVGLFDSKFTLKMEVTDVYGQKATADRAVDPIMCKTGDLPQNEPAGLFASATLFSIYPNPASGMLTITAADRQHPGGRVEVFNVLGECITAFRLSDVNTHVDVSGFAPGMYIFNIHTPDGQYSTRIVIE